MGNGTFRVTVTTSTMIGLMVIFCSYFARANEKLEEKVESKATIKMIEKIDADNKEAHSQLLAKLEEQAEEQISQGLDIREIMTTLKTMSKK